MVLQVPHLWLWSHSVIGRLPVSLWGLTQQAEDRPVLRVSVRGGICQQLLGSWMKIQALSPVPWGARGMGGPPSPVDLLHLPFPYVFQDFWIPLLSLSPVPVMNGQTIKTHLSTSSCSPPALPGSCHCLVSLPTIPTPALSQAILNVPGGQGVEALW